MKKVNTHIVIKREDAIKYLTDNASGMTGIIYPVRGQACPPAPDATIDGGRYGW